MIYESKFGAITYACEMKAFGLSAELEQRLAVFSLFHS